MLSFTFIEITHTHTYIKLIFIFFINFMRFNVSSMNLMINLKIKYVKNV
jgi:hypothetical protein